VPIAIVFDVLEQFRTRQIAASLYDTRELAVTDYAAMPDATLGAKIELNLSAFNTNVMVLERREAKAFVLPRILGITDARQGALHQSHDGSQNFFTRQARSSQVSINLSADCRQSTPEDKHVLELRVVSYASPSRMIAILFAAARVAPSGLDMTVWIGTNPYFGPRWRPRSSMVTPEGSR